MAKWIIAPALMSVAFSSGWGQTKDTLVGTWKLISATDKTEKGEVTESFGRNPTGLLTYTAEGRMIGIITFDGRKRLSVPDYISAPAQERAEAFATMVAYAGRYTFAGDKVIHHVEAAWMENYVNTDQVRFIVRFQGNRLTLRTPPFLKGGVKLANQELEWERMKPEPPGPLDRN
jgi:Lipocalin-like domain